MSIIHVLNTLMFVTILSDRHVLEEGGVTLEKIHTNMNSTDMLTKVVSTKKFRLCVTSLGKANA